MIFQVILSCIRISASIQANTFKNWVNVNLDEINSECKRVGKADLEEDFRDGTILCALVEKLQKRRIRHACRRRFSTWLILSSMAMAWVQPYMET